MVKVVKMLIMLINCLTINQQERVKNLYQKNPVKIVKREATKQQIKINFKVTTIQDFQVI